MCSLVRILSGLINTYHIANMPESKQGPRPPRPPTGTKKHRGFLAAWVDEQQERRRYLFAKDELNVLPVGDSSRYGALKRLEATGRIVPVGSRRGLWAIIPPEYRKQGAPPLTWILDDIMRAAGLPYYIGLRSAAEVYGATHYPIQTLQVVTARRFRPFILGRQAARFIAKSTVSDTPVRVRQGPVTNLKYSTPEATALDLVRYANLSGGMNNVMTALEQMQQECHPAGMRQALDAAQDVANAQRLGYLWNTITHEVLAQVVERWLATRHVSAVPLEAGAEGRDRAALTADHRWKLVLEHPPTISL